MRIIQERGANFKSVCCQTFYLFDLICRTASFNNSRKRISPTIFLILKTLSINGFIIILHKSHPSWSPKCVQDGFSNNCIVPNPIESQLPWRKNQLFLRRSNSVSLICAEQWLEIHIWRASGGRKTPLWSTPACCRIIKKAASPNLYLDCRGGGGGRRVNSIFKVAIASIFGHCLIGSALVALIEPAGGI